jgi:hypothetical protein
LTSVLVGGEWSASLPGRCAPGEIVPGHPFDRRLGGPRRSENSCHHRDSNCDPLVVQPVASRYTDGAIALLQIFRLNNVTDWAAARRRISKHVPANPHPTIERRPLLGNRPVKIYLCETGFSNYAATET